MFFYFLNVKLPCCLREFYHILFTVTIKWNKAFTGFLFVNDDGFDFLNHKRDSIADVIGYQKEEIYAYLLSNIGFLFLLHIIFLIVFIVCSVLLFIYPKNSFFRNFKTSLDNCGLVSFFLMFHMAVWVFVFYNFKQFEAGNSYYVFSLILAIAYLITTVCYYAYCAYRLLGPGIYFMEDKNLKKFTYFFCGY